MKAAVVVIGVGEIGAVFARGFLKLGHPVIPALRGDDLQAIQQQVETPAAVIVAVGESQLAEVLSTIPKQWLSVLVLLQNELLPRDWDKLSTAPTIISIWFEKKKGQDSKVIIPSPTFGPLAEQLYKALATLDIAVKQIGDEKAMLSELVVKNLYILTTNIAGLEVGGNVGQLWQSHRDVAEAVFDDVLKIQEALTKEIFDRQELLDLMLVAFDGDPEHMCMGRSAPARLQRALQQAEELSLSLNKLPTIEIPN